ncbi:lipid II:glycine glycyltransferase FemX [Micromonospora zhanjiangensis]|uniref:Lipid II:glycine glycyltransferase FemX n=1 Tax=Micromonospora zhanjiangensis TaxID=1522057 RepID=A0ABV8KIQ9_9ACTN
MDFEIWNARRPTDNARWRAVHDAWRHREVFAHPSYVGLFAGPDDVPMAAYAATDHGFVLYPFVLRPVDATHLRAAAGRPLRDITSAYGYGGPFHSDIDEVAAKNFWSRFDDFCRGQGVVTEFVRIPVLRHHLLPYPGQVEPKLTNVVRDLTTPPGVMWYEFEHKVRKNVKRARQRGVTVEVDEHGAHLDDFLRIYHGTMRRRAADAAYHFPRHMFERLGQELPGQFVFFHARHGGEIVSTELVLVSADHIYSYLGGTVAAAFDVRPNDLLKFAIIEWGRQHGKTSFVLGGGYTPDDGIVRYKRSFAPTGLVPYSVGSRVLDKPAYERLVRAHRAEGRRRDPTWSPDEGYFPAYRSPLPPSTAPAGIEIGM